MSSAPSEGTAPSNLAADAAPHRPEIDGLRALAVLPVILFHAGFAVFSGGYVGVDVFFVISGFLITTIIANGLRKGEFSLVRFYERRARRILPALFFVMLVCLPVAWIWLLPAELTKFGQSIMSVSVFASNVFFWRSSGYFGVAGEENPLLHTWSLGVEEQYYVLFPIAMLMCWRLGLRRLFWLVALVGLASLAISEWLLGRSPIAAFFLIPTRAWELFAGSLLALHNMRKLNRGALSPLTRESIGWIGILLILAPVFLYDATTAFPGIAALPPVIGTALILAFVSPATSVGRLLTLRPVLWLGLVSYSAYLWHQPILAFARVSQPGNLTLWATGLSIVATLILAHLSWRFIEAPFRDRKRWSRRQIFVSASASTLVFLSIGGTLVLNRGVPERWNENLLGFLSPDKTRIASCPAVDAWLQVCQLGETGKPPKVALIGDSHADAIATALDEALRDTGSSGLVVHTTCHPIPGVFDSREILTPEHIVFCKESEQRLLDYIEKSGVETYVVAIRWTGRLYPMGNAIDAPFFDNNEGGIERDYPYRRNVTVSDTGEVTDAAEPKALAVARLLETLAQSRKTVVLYPIPEVGWPPARLNLIAINKAGAVPASISTSWERFAERNAAAHRILNSIDSPNLRRSKPESLLCNTFLPARCAVQVDDDLYYSDDDHLSMKGARLIVKDLLNR